LTHFDFGSHFPVGQRHFAAFRLKSAPANVHSPCWQRGVSFRDGFVCALSGRLSGMMGAQPRASKSP
jgi:hypothetical protein